MLICKDKSDTVAAMEEYLGRRFKSTYERYYSLGGIRTVRLVTFDEKALRMLDRQLKWSRTGPVDSPDAKIILFQEDSLADFHSRVLGSGVESEDSYIQVGERRVTSGGVEFKPYMDIDLNYGTLLMDSGNVFYHAVRSFEPHIWGKDGHLLVKIFYGLLNTPVSSLVHSACVGLDGNGLLFCARAMRGKSTLTITAMLKGFEYVSDDYLIIERSEGGLFASPVYNITNLSPEMYDALYDDLDKARYVCPSATQNKYTLDISAYEDRLRRHYPIRAALIPVIDTSVDKPRVEPCDPADKGAGIAALIHSTISQVWDRKPSGTIMKVSSMLTPLPFYKMILSPDIFSNVECLRRFIRDTFPY